MYHIFILIFVFLLSGCTGKPPAKRLDLTTVNTFRIKENVETKKNYKLGAIKNSFVGEGVVRKKVFFVKSQSEFVAVPAMDITLKNQHLTIFLDKGKEYPIKYKVNSGGKPYSVMEAFNQRTEHYFGILFDDDKRIHNRVLDGNIEIPDMFNISPLNGSVNVVQTTLELERKVLENFEIIFGGINNNQINFVYREYTADDVAKTAFFQELTYPITSKFIRYKSLKIKVREIDGESITYQVIEE